MPHFLHLYPPLELYRLCQKKRADVTHTSLFLSFKPGVKRRLVVGKSRLAPCEGGGGGFRPFGRYVTGSMYVCMYQTPAAEFVFLFQTSPSTRRKEKNRKSVASKGCSDDDAQRQHADKDTV